MISVLFLFILVLLILLFILLLLLILLLLILILSVFVVHKNHPAFVNSVYRKQGVILKVSQKIIGKRFLL